MADKHNHNGTSAGGFLVGFFAGAAIGAGLGMLFAPKPGTELRSQLGHRTSELVNTASKGYQLASEAAGRLAKRVATDTADQVSRRAS